MEQLEYVQAKQNYVQAKQAHQFLKHCNLVYSSDIKYKKVFSANLYLDPSAANISIREFAAYVGILDSLANVKENFKDYGVILYVNNNLMNRNNTNIAKSKLDHRDDLNVIVSTFFKLAMLHKNLSVVAYDCGEYTDSHYFSTTARFLPFYDTSYEEIHVRFAASTFGNIFDKSNIDKWLAGRDKYYIFNIFNQQLPKSRRPHLHGENFIDIPDACFGGAPFREMLDLQAFSDGTLFFKEKIASAPGINLSQTIYDYMHKRGLLIFYSELPWHVRENLDNVINHANENARTEMDKLYMLFMAFIGMTCFIKCMNKPEIMHSILPSLYYSERDQCYMIFRYLVTVFHMFSKKDDFIECAKPAVKILNENFMCNIAESQIFNMFKALPKFKPTIEDEPQQPVSEPYTGNVTQVAKEFMDRCSNILSFIMPNPKKIAQIQLNAFDKKMRECNSNYNMQDQAFIRKIPFSDKFVVVKRFNQILKMQCMMNGTIYNVDLFSKLNKKSINDIDNNDNTRHILDYHTLDFGSDQTFARYDMSSCYQATHVLYENVSGASISELNNLKGPEIANILHQLFHVLNYYHKKNYRYGLVYADNFVVNARKLKLKFPSLLVKYDAGEYIDGYRTALSKRYYLPSGQNYDLVMVAKIIKHLMSTGTISDGHRAMLMNIIAICKKLGDFLNIIRENRNSGKFYHDKDANLLMQQQNALIDEFQAVLKNYHNLDINMECEKMRKVKQPSPL